MRLALVGARGSGKSTLFRAFTGAAAPAAGGPPGAAPVAVVKVRDPRLERLRDLFQPRKYTPAAIEVLDLPGIAGPGDDPGMRRAELLSAARESDGLLVVVRAFEEPSYPYGDARPDAAREAAHVVGELAFADLDVATKRLEKLRAGGRKSGVKEQEAREAAALERIVAALEGGGAVRDVALSADEEKLLRGFRFLTLKRLVLVVSLPEGGDASVADRIEGPFGARAGLCGRAEAEVAELEPADRDEFLRSMGIERPAAEVLLEASFRGLGLLTFFTVGEDEVRAWTMREGGSAVDAAGCIHSDLSRGFIRAEVTDCAELLAQGSLAAVRKAGKQRLEGRDYVVRDGDVINVRFSV